MKTKQMQLPTLLFWVFRLLKLSFGLEISPRISFEQWTWSVFHSNLQVQEEEDFLRSRPQEVCPETHTGWKPFREQRWAASVIWCRQKPRSTEWLEVGAEAGRGKGSDMKTVINKRSSPHDFLYLGSHVSFTVSLEEIRNFMFSFGHWKEENKHFKNYETGKQARSWWVISFTFFFLNKINSVIESLWNTQLQSCSLLSFNHKIFNPHPFITAHFPSTIFQVFLPPYHLPSPLPASKAGISPHPISTCFLKSPQVFNSTKVKNAFILSSVLKYILARVQLFCSRAPGENQIRTDLKRI